MTERQAHRDPVFNQVLRREVRRLGGCPVCVHKILILGRWACQKKRRFRGDYSCGFQHEE